ncbi:hypothetical protein AKJ52_01865 [candidate division MSBL1 archaeon SCGC-AAA382C18]|uniref:Uncharacterized protein n=1 Tax=candidate division MSBL1 archaeon SCGC-AAA382C18 TaxID=1698281 RepID=A0A133VJR4_9EURY|nr:hypothetical protein AKJ52_01865 [candidate division MSBL1 archaeon SCGC-AAA382C18]
MGGRYFFKYYFQNEELFEEFSEYYDRFGYRFEVGKDELEDLVEKLESHGYSVKIVEEDEISEYTVVIDKFEKHSDLLKKAVDSLEMEVEKALVMRDKVAKEEALGRGREPDDKWINHLGI